MSITHRVLPLTLLIATSVVFGCKRNSMPVELPAEKPTTAEVRAFGQAMAQALSDGCDARATAALLDAEALANRVARATQGAMPAELIEPKLASGQREVSLCRAVGPDGRAHFLRVREVDGEPRALIRLSGGGLTYLEFLVTRRDQKVRAADVYTYSAGSLLSTVFAQIFTQGMAPGGAGALRNAKAVNAANAAAAKGDYVAARAALEGVSAEMRHSKALLVTDLQYAAFLDDETYQRAIADFARRFPGDPALDLIALDGHIMRKDHAALLETIDRLDARVGGDPFLDTIRALGRGMAGDVPGAEALYLQAMKGSPETDDAHWGLVTLYLEQRQFAKLDPVWARLEADHGTTPDPALMREEPMYAAYLQSPEWQAYLARRQGAAEGATPAADTPPPRP